MNHFRPRTFTALVVALACAAPAYPWGKQGHEAIGQVASENLSADARSHVVKILGNDDLGSIAVWMDELRSAYFHTGPLGTDPEALKFCAEFPNSTEWHYVDMPLGVTDYHLDDAFARNDDVVHMIEEAVAVLEGGGDKRITKRNAIFMLVHLVGDEHQPLHVGNGYYLVTPGAAPAAPALAGAALPKGTAQLVTDPAACKGLPNDKGGNALFFGPGKWDELHGYWDTEIVTKVAGSRDIPTLAAVIQKRIAAEGSAWKSSGDYHHWPEEWATESLAAARTAYSGIVFGAETPEPNGGIKRIEITLPLRYDDVVVPLAEQRLAQGAYHLTEILNSIHWAD